MTDVNFTPTQRGVVAVTVTFAPDLDLLAAQLDRLVPQVEAVVIVDNGSHAALKTWEKARQEANVEVLPLGKNYGIAAAQNVGIQWARDYGAEFVLLMDQDSIPASDMVEKLISTLAEQPSPAAAGPRYLDERQNNPQSPFVRIRGLTLGRCSCAGEDSVVPVDFLISSGCLIPMSVLDEVGGMREEMFIDYVDTEWVWRARHYGFQSYGVCSAHMQHSLGDHPINFAGKNITLRSALRHYYLFRNAVLLYKEPWVPLNWKLADGRHLFLKYGVYLLFATPRLKHFYMMNLGILHGLLGRTGKL